MKLPNLLFWGFFFFPIPWLAVWWYNWIACRASGDLEGQHDTFQRLVVAMGWFVIFLLTVKAAETQTPKSHN